MQRVVFLLTTTIIVWIGFALSERHSLDAKWESAEGTVHGTRIVPDHAVETKWGSRLIFRGDYLVAYSASGREYELWIDSGIRSESEPSVRMSLAQLPTTCEVWYNQNKPEISTGDCH